MDNRQIKRLERVFKGTANHWRIRILFILSSHSDITLGGIVEKLRSNYQTTAEHTRRLGSAGLIIKKYRGRSVIHNLSPYGVRMVQILRNFPK